MAKDDAFCPMKFVASSFHLELYTFLRIIFALFEVCSRDQPRESITYSITVNKIVDQGNLVSSQNVESDRRFIPVGD